MLSGDKLGKAKQILSSVRNDEKIIEKLNLDKSELDDLIEYIGRIIVNWRICD
jgi:hypothetical protein